MYSQIWVARSRKQPGYCKEKSDKATKNLPEAGELDKIWGRDGA